MLAQFPRVRRVLGEVKADNEASVRAFRRAGFAQTEAAGPAGGLTFVWIAAPAA
ncbi:hypothetical protein [Hymenobacter sp. BRD67]|uniref:hypothetical protein n=1 Tax=Hymenobacter sp. BRD67 TaxID=2675877 RepID=UPI003977D358